MKWAAELEKWCWREKPRKASNSELFSMSRSLSSRQEISKDDMEKAVRDAVSSRPGKQQAQKNAVKDNLQRFDEQAQEELLNALNEFKQGSAGKKARGKGSSHHRPDEKDSEQSASDTSDTASLSQVAASILDELQKHYPANENLKKLKNKIRYIRTIKQLIDKIEDFSEELDEPYRESTEQLELARGQGRIGGLSLQQGGKDLLPADGFDRLPRAEEEKESFAGFLTDDAAEALKHEAHSPWLKNYPTSSLLDQVMNLGRKRRALEG